MLGWKKRQQEETVPAEEHRRNVNELQSQLEQANETLEEANANTRAVIGVVNAVGAATTVEETISAALDTVRDAFGWAYGSYWNLDEEDQALKFAQESGTVNDEFRAATETAAFREGVGLSGRAWKQRDLFFVKDIGEMTDCCRAPVAQRAGVKSGVCFPIMIDGNVVGTMDFFATETLEPSAERLDALRNVGRLVSQALDRVREKDLQAESAADTQAVNQVLAAVQGATSVEDAVKTALDTVKEAFGWAYGSYWYLDRGDRALKFSLESGSVNEEFRRATESAAFEEGIGLSGRTWKQRDLFFVKDIGEMTDCCRAPVAQRAGVKSGVCFPVIVRGEVVGTMDFFATETLNPSQGRLDALRNVGRLVSQAVERIQDAEALRDKVDQLLVVVNAAANGDLTHHVGFSGSDAVGELAGGLEKMLNDLRSIIGQVVESSNQFAEGARVIAESSQTLASGAQTQSSSVEEMSASIEELTRSVQAVKENAGDANSLAQQANKMAEEGGSAVQRSVEGMEKIRASSTQIAEIIQVISEIASQTNLLALNAAIEAARAGEHGLGFAVVADEVRKLAERSNQAAGEISTLIRESTQQVEQGAQLSEETGEALKRIIEGVESTAVKIGEIASATVEQANNANEVAQAIQGIAEVTEQSAAGSEEMASSSEELGAQANTLRELVQRFRVEQATAEA